MSYLCYIHDKCTYNMIQFWHSDKILGLHFSSSKPKTQVGLLFKICLLFVILIVINIYYISLIFHEKIKLFLNLLYIYMLFVLYSTIQLSYMFLKMNNFYQLSLWYKYLGNDWLKAEGLHQRYICLNILLCIPVFFFHLLWTKIAKCLIFTLL